MNGSPPQAAARALRSTAVAWPAVSGWPGPCPAAAAPGQFPASRAVQVARMPRGIGASSGVNETVTRGAPAASLSSRPAASPAAVIASPSACSISGVCRCVPPTW